MTAPAKPAPFGSHSVNCGCVIEVHTVDRPDPYSMTLTGGIVKRCVSHSPPTPPPATGALPEGEIGDCIKFLTKCSTAINESWHWTTKEWIKRLRAALLSEHARADEAEAVAADLRGFATKWRLAEERADAATKRAEELKAERRVGEATQAGLRAEGLEAVAALRALGCKRGDGGWERPCESFSCGECAIAGIHNRGIAGQRKNCCNGTGWLAITPADANGEGK